jgi:CarD family transcriptional regulator
VSDGALQGKNRMSKARKTEFRPDDYVVYPAHGVGQIISIEEQDVAGLTLELFVISFEKDKMTLRVPTNKATEIGMRSLSSPDVISKAMTTLKGKARVKRAMWSRRAQEYEQKINSGDLIAIAEVVRDLHRSDDQREQSYSERQLYEAALERLTREVAAASGGDEVQAARQVDEVLISRAA